MLAEQILRIFSGVFVGIYIARFLGPEQFGVLSYVLAVSGFAIAVARLGMEVILVRELVNSPKKESELMGTSFWLMTVSAIVCYTILAAIIVAFEESDEVKKYALIVATSTFFTSFLSIDYLYQSKLKAKYSTVCKVFALLIMSLAKLGLIYFQAGLFWFVIASVLDHAILALFLLLAITRTTKLDFFKKFNKKLAFSMLRSALPLVLAALAGMILMRIDQIMIRNALDLHQVGIYSAAVRVYEAWIVLPYILTVSLLPAIVKLKQGDRVNYHKRLVQLFQLVIWISIFTAVIVTTYSDEIILTAFGESYADAGPVLSIVMWTAVFSAVGALSSRYYNVEHMERKILFRIAVAAALNIALNFILIPKYGITGPAYSTLFCMFFTTYVMDWFDKDLKVLLSIKHRALFPLTIKKKK